MERKIANHFPLQDHPRQPKRHKAHATAKKTYHTLSLVYEIYWATAIHSKSTSLAGFHKGAHLLSRASRGLKGFESSCAIDAVSVGYDPSNRLLTWIVVFMEYGGKKYRFKIDESAVPFVPTFVLLIWAKMQSVLTSKNAFENTLKSFQCCVSFVT